MLRQFAIQSLPDHILSALTKQVTENLQKHTVENKDV